MMQHFKNNYFSMNSRAHHNRLVTLVGCRIDTLDAGLIIVFELIQVQTDILCFES